MTVTDDELVEQGTRVALRLLPGHQAAVVIAVILLEMNYRQAAELTGLTVSAVRAAAVLGIRDLERAADMPSWRLAQAEAMLRRAGHAPSRSNPGAWVRPPGWVARGALAGGRSPIDRRRCGFRLPGWARTHRRRLPRNPLASAVDAAPRPDGIECDDPLAVIDEVQHSVVADADPHRRHFQ